MENQTKFKSTREQADNLKKSWEQDPCWDIYPVEEGFEEYEQEFKEFQERKTAEWDAQYEQKVKNEMERMGLAYPEQKAIYGHLKNLEFRIQQLEEKWDNL